MVTIHKKGFIRTLEAVIAIIMILSLIYLIIPKTEVDVSQTPPLVEERFTLIFNEITYNEAYRDCVLSVTNFGELRNSGDPCANDINDYIRNNGPYGYSFEAEICESAVTCLHYTLPTDKTIYAESIFIASEPSRVFRVYFWPL